MARYQKTVKITVKRDSDDIILLYRLSEEKDNLYPNFNCAYSITVTKIDCGGKRREIKHISDISRNIAEAERIFKLISRGRVTPMCLEEVLDELYNEPFTVV